MIRHLILPIGTSEDGNSHAAEEGTVPAISEAKKKSQASSSVPIASAEEACAEATSGPAESASNSCSGSASDGNNVVSDIFPSEGTPTSLAHKNPTPNASLVSQSGGLGIVEADRADRAPRGDTKDHSLNVSATFAGSASALAASATSDQFRLMQHEPAAMESSEQDCVPDRDNRYGSKCQSDGPAVKDTRASAQGTGGGCKPDGIPDASLDDSMSAGSVDNCRQSGDTQPNTAGLAPLVDHSSESKFLEWGDAESHVAGFACAERIRDLVPDNQTLTATDAFDSGDNNSGQPHLAQLLAPLPAVQRESIEFRLTQVPEIQLPDGQSTLAAAQDNHLRQFRAYTLPTHAHQQDVASDGAWINDALHNTTTQCDGILQNPRPDSNGYSEYTQENGIFSNISGGMTTDWDTEIVRARPTPMLVVNPNFVESVLPANVTVTLEQPSEFQQARLEHRNDCEQDTQVLLHPPGSDCSNYSAWAGIDFEESFFQDAFPEDFVWTGPVTPSL